MGAIVPPSRPRLSRAELRALLAPFNLDRARDPLLIVGIRGYYRDTLGVPGRNDRGIYDDALIVDGPEVTYAFNANTDPGGYRPGHGFEESKRGMASLKPGLYRAHRFGIHRRGTPGAHEALVQIGGPVTVIRDGNPPYEHTGMFGINIHRGGQTKTNSLGCQTIPPHQWPAFYATVVDQARRAHGAGWKGRTIPYVLLEAK